MVGVVYQPVRDVQFGAGREDLSDRIGRDAASSGSISMWEGYDITSTVA